jgi:hypothetical protein
MHEKMSPVFFEEASNVVNSPYFYERCDSNDPETIIAFGKKRDAERDLVIEAVGQCHTYDELTGAAKEIYDRALCSIVEYANDADYRERIGGESIGFNSEQAQGTGHEGEQVEQSQPVAPQKTSRQEAAEKAALTRKRRAAGQKAALTRKRRAAGRKAAETRKARKNADQQQEPGPAPTSEPAI